MVHSSPMDSGTGQHKHPPPQALVLIPARYQSSRFPGKPLAQLNQRSLIQTVHHNMQQSGYPAWVVTDDQRIEKHLKESGTQQVIRIDDPVANGTLRIALAYQRCFKQQSLQFIVNVQGDEPLLKGSAVSQLVEWHQHHDFAVTTLVRPRQGSPEDFHHPHTVKVKLGAQGQCLNFSRTPLGKLAEWFQHVGVYCYQPWALERFCSQGPCPREQHEGLEQLRGLHLGLTYGALPYPHPLRGVDTPEDLAAVQEELHGQ